MKVDGTFTNRLDLRPPRQLVGPASCIGKAAVQEPRDVVIESGYSRHLNRRTR